jgi:2,3-bisphosphoglycerate-independent phosphoglycerate mutase
MPPRPALLCILDGWGYRPDHAEDNAIAAAATPHYTRLLKDCPHALLETSGNAVGLPKGQMGNSEVGHMNIGAGRVVAQTCRASMWPSRTAASRVGRCCST